MSDENVFANKEDEWLTKAKENIDEWGLQTKKNLEGDR